MPDEDLPEKGSISTCNNCNREIICLDSFSMIDGFKIRWVHTATHDSACDRTAKPGNNPIFPPNYNRSLTWKACHLSGTISAHQAAGMQVVCCGITYSPSNISDTEVILQ